jgi:hypothetical protein
MAKHSPILMVILTSVASARPRRLIEIVFDVFSVLVLFEIQKASPI